MLPAIGHQWIDERRAPLYVVRFPPTATDDAVDAYCKTLGTWWSRVREPVGFIVDARGVEGAPAKQRKRFGEQEELNRPYTRKHHAGLALVVSSQVVRGIITAVYWLAPPNYEHVVLTDMAAAEAWIAARLPADRRQAG